MATLAPLPSPALRSSRGQRLHAWVREIAPLPRSLTGDGVRETLARLSQITPIEVTEIASGTPVGDWTVPDEWTVHEAYVALPDGRRIVDVADHPLHLVQYSRPVRARMTLAALRPHLHTLPDRPRWIPYRTSYYAPAWGFCLTHDTLAALAEAVGEDGELDVVVDTTLAPGAMTIGECVVPGETNGELLLSAHVCHPAMANDNASALVVAAEIAAWWAKAPRRHTLRVVWAPGTVGAVAWLATHAEARTRVRGGYVLANLGDGGGLTYKTSRRGTLGPATSADRAVTLAARDLGAPLAVLPFDPTGYDERQYGSPGVDLPVGRLTRSPHGAYPEYHTSADDVDFVTPEALADSFEVLAAALEALDGDAHYTGTVALGEPMLGRHGLYAPVGGVPQAPEAQRAMLWVLSLADGRHSLLDTAERSGLAVPTVRAAADRLLDAGLLAAAPDA